MKFAIIPIKRLYKEYYRLGITTDSGKHKYIDIEPNEFKNLYLQMKEFIEMDSLNVDLSEV